MAVADELRGKYVDEIEIGATAIFGKTVTEADILRGFVWLTGGQAAPPAGRRKA